ncbi:amidase family protein [Haloarcula sp. S1CR25-12]|uniref:Amidase family protein n=1 Tax=Haloarcula saliterrae TaxID=2950534 RepID=A0ABU2FE79_9EURY|nr:amidase family protein [Haloarcula sp. S1CR25-12]MDS0260565.1 amidase family protein [Haloarcula sp. S1CR25-12]
MSSPLSVPEATIGEIHRAMDEGTLTSAELVETYLDRIAAYDRDGPELTAIVTVNPDARARAATLDDEFAASGPVGPLHGIPVLVKDQAETAGIPTSFGSEAFSEYTPTEDAELVARIKDAGGIVLAKTNLPDWAASWFGYSSVLGETKNPYALDRDPGGSSAGTGAGVAANLGTVGVGEDTGGSVRVPASCCNLFGIRVTTGLISRTGLSPLVTRQDTAGPMARTVTDMTRLLDVMVGYDPADRWTGAVHRAQAADYLDQLDTDALSGARLGVLRDAFGDDGDPDAEPVNAVVEVALERIADAGATLVDPVTIPDLDERIRETSLYVLQSKRDLNDFFAARDDAPVDSVTELYDRDAYHDKLDLFADIATDGPADPTAAESYWRKVAAQEALQREIRYVHAEHDLDALIFPDVQVVPPTRATLQAGIDTAAYPTNTVIGSQSSCPAVSMPAGFTDDGLPVGVELLGTPFRESSLLSLAYSYEQAVDPRRPPEHAPELPT